MLNFDAKKGQIVHKKKYNFLKLDKTWLPLIYV